MKRQTYTFIFAIISLTTIFISSCTYKNELIPDIVQFQIDTTIINTDTAGFIYGTLFEDQSEKGKIFEAYTMDNYVGDSILSISTAYKGKNLNIFLNNNELGRYVSKPDLNTPMSCIVLLNTNTSGNPLASLVNLRVGEIILSSYDDNNRVYRGTIDVSNIGFGTKTYEFKGVFAFKMRNLSSIPIPL